MAITVERPVARGGVLVAEPPVISPEEPETPILSPVPRKTSRRKLLGWGLAAATLAGGTYVAHRTGILGVIGSAFEQREQNIQKRETLANRPLGPLGGESVNWWMELPEE